MNTLRTKPKRRRFQFSLRTLLISVGVCALGIGVAEFCYHRYLAGPVKDSRAALQLAAMLNAHLDAKGCAWPQSWDELREFYRGNGRVRGGDYCTFAEVRDCWIIDFRADPIELARARPRVGEPPFRALRQRRNRRMAYPQWDPNLRIHWRLRGHAGLQVAAMVIRHLEASRGAWPTSWEDLKKEYPRALKPEGGHYCSYEQARGCMVVDFDADPAEFARAKGRLDRPPFRVIYPRFGYPGEEETCGGAFDPNQRIFAYLKSRSPQDPSAADEKPPRDG